MKLIALLFSCLLLQTGLAQNYVDIQFEIETSFDIEYRTASDFGGNERSLLLDLSLPIGDSLPECGRPLAVIVHGGAFLVGDKADSRPAQLREDFAGRGYAAAAIQYRLGMFHTSSNVHCNVSNLGIEWDCFNMTDSSEWYRAYYRAIQDVHAAIRFLADQPEMYQIDPENIFLIGESAGGFIVMGAGFLDDGPEVLEELIAEQQDVPAPNAIYDLPCIQGFGLDTSIASLSLTRPDLGAISPVLPLPYEIQGVASFYGGAFNNIFGSQNASIPALYLFHQPNDLIVPYAYNRLLAGYAYCATQFPFNCAYIINRPFAYGSQAIAELLDGMAANGQAIPEYLFESTSNTTDCAGQIINPSQQGHNLDSYSLRTENVAAFFAEQINPCLPSRVVEKTIRKTFSIAPSLLARPELQVLGPLTAGTQLRVWTFDGQLVYDEFCSAPAVGKTIALPLKTAGVYLLLIQNESLSEVHPFFYTPE